MPENALMKRCESRGSPGLVVTHQVSFDDFQVSFTFKGYRNQSGELVFFAQHGSLFTCRNRSTCSCKGGPIHQEEVRPWKEFFRVLFDQDVAAVSLTGFDGRIVDCNERFARIFGFESRAEVLVHSAWDFYFDRSQREALIEQLKLHGNCPAEEVYYRDRNGRPILLLISRSLAGEQPALILSVAIGGAAQDNVRLEEPQAYASTARGQSAGQDQIADVSEKVSRLLHRATQILQEDNLPKMSKAEIREVLFVLEEIKMLMSELEILRLPPK